MLYILYCDGVDISTNPFNPVKDYEKTGKGTRDNNFLSLFPRSYPLSPSCVWLQTIILQYCI